MGAFWDDSCWAIGNMPVINGTEIYAVNGEGNKSQQEGAAACDDKSPTLPVIHRNDSVE